MARKNVFIYKYIPIDLELTLHEHGHAPAIHNDALTFGNVASKTAKVQGSATHACEITTTIHRAGPPAHPYEIT